MSKWRRSYRRWYRRFHGDDWYPGEGDDNRRRNRMIRELGVRENRGRFRFQRRMRPVMAVVRRRARLRAAIRSMISRTGQVHRPAWYIIGEYIGMPNREIVKVINEFS